MKKNARSLRDQVAALETLAGLKVLTDAEAVERNGGISATAAPSPKLHRGSGKIAVRLGSGAVAYRRGSGAIAVPAPVVGG